MKYAFLTGASKSDSSTYSVETMRRRRLIASGLVRVVFSVFIVLTIPAAFASDQTPGSEGKPRRHAVFHVENATTDLTIKYRVRWGTGNWGDEVTLKSGDWYNHQWRYDPSAVPAPPTPEIRFSSGI